MTIFRTAKAILPVVSNSVFSHLQLQLSVEEAQSRVLEMEQELNSLQRERDDTQRAALLLQSSVDQLTQVRTLLTVGPHQCIFLPSLGKAQEPFQVQQL